MKITNEQHDHYWTHGWVAVDGVYAPAFIDESIRAIMDMAARDLKETDGAMLIDRSSDGREWLPRKLSDVFVRNEYFRRFLFPSPITSLIEQLIGVKPLLMADEFFFKPPRHGSEKPYHQDNSYFLAEPADHVLNAWIAFDDADEANGCLRYIRGSHREPILPNASMPGSEYHLTIDPKLIDLSREEFAPVKKGGVVFHHGNALHYSAPNRSDRWRRAYATFWVSGETTMAENFRVNAYFSKEELWKDLPANARGGVTAKA